MNDLWSTRVQGVRTLYDSRTLRFADRFREAYVRAFALDAPASVLEVGCGPGALARTLKRWYPSARVEGVDRDDNFIRFAREHIPEASFRVGDALALPYPDGTFDATVSHTVVEHVPTDGFFAEQFRVLRPGGVCLTMSVRRSVNIEAPCLASSPMEDALWERIGERFMARNREAGVAAYARDERELPLAMERAGFSDVSTRYLTVSLTPDDSDCPPETARAIIEENRQTALESAEALRAVVPEDVTAEEVEAVKTLRNARYDRRLALYEAGERQWDTYASLLMVLRGVKR